MGLNYTEREQLRNLRGRRWREAQPQWRTFVCITGGHNKFWKIALGVREILTQYGANGTEGVELRKTFNTNWGALDYYDAKIREKLNKGYEELR